MIPTPDGTPLPAVPTTPPPSPISPKVWASTVLTLVASLVLALVTAVMADPSSLEQFPAWARFVLVATLPTLAAFLGGYAKRDHTREVGQVVLDEYQGEHRAQ